MSQTEVSASIRIFATELQYISLYLLCLSAVCPCHFFVLYNLYLCTSARLQDASGAIFSSTVLQNLSSRGRLVIGTKKL